MPTIYILAGHDPTSGAGITADCAAARDNGIHPVTIPSVLTVQNSLHFNAATTVPAHIVKTLFSTLFEEFPPVVLKTGFLPVFDNGWMSEVALIADSFRTVVIDPILKATTAENRSDLSEAWIRFISGPGRIITPNLPELFTIYRAITAGEKNPGHEQAARVVHRELGCSVVVTGEDRNNFVSLMHNGKHSRLPVARIETNGAVHGTGCRFSTALASFILTGQSLPDAAAHAVRYMEHVLHRTHRFTEHGQQYIVP